MPRMRFRWGADRYALGPYCIVGRRAVMIRVGRLVLSLAWVRR